MTCMFITSVREQMCKTKNALEHENAVEDRIPDLSQVYSWVSRDPKDKHQTQGLIMRQGLTTPPITEGLKSGFGKDFHCSLGCLFESSVCLGLQRETVKGSNMDDGNASVQKKFSLEGKSVCRGCDRVSPQ